jgi:hypothetical protein
MRKGAQNIPRLRSGWQSLGWRLPFVIPPAPASPGSNQFADGNLRKKRHCQIATDARPGGPTAKREPSPEGLGLSPQNDPARRRCATKPGSAPICVFRSAADLSRRSRGGICCASFLIATAQPSGGIFVPHGGNPNNRFMKPGVSKPDFNSAFCLDASFPRNIFLGGLGCALPGIHARKQYDATRVPAPDALCL